MKIDQLPPEILLKICSYCEKLNEISHVNNLFNKIACKLSVNVQCLRIDREYFNTFISHNEWIHSMQISNRQVPEMEIVGFFLDSEQERILFAIKKFSVTIKLLRIQHDAANELIILEILSLAQNLERLELSDLDNPYTSTTDQSSVRHCFNDVPILRNLKHLSVIDCKIDFGRVFSRIPTGCLRSFHLFWYLYPWEALIERQSKIKALHLGYKQESNRILTADTFDKLKLETLELKLYNVTSDTILAIVKKQTELKNLTLTGEAATDERVMMLIGKISELETLTMHIRDTHIIRFLQLKKLKKLDDFALTCDDRGSAATLQTFAAKNTSGAKWSVRWSDEFSSEYTLGRSNVQCNQS